MSDEKLPVARLDRSALERVVARAAELQAGSAEPGEDYSEDQVLELGKEVGIAPQHLRQALAEERTRVAIPDEGRGLGMQLLGAARIAASRTIPGSTRDILGAIDTWMQRDQCLVVKRKFADRIVWEARNDLVGVVRRAFHVGGHGYELSLANEVAATVVPVDDGRVLVRLDADLSKKRMEIVEYTAGGTLVGIGGSVALAVMGFASIVVPVPAIALGAAFFAGSRASHSHRLTRAQLALEQLLDRLERPEPKPPSLLGALAAAAAALPPKRAF